MSDTITTQADQFDKLIYDTAKAYPVAENFAKLLVAQARHETGNYTSNVFKLNNNAYGYKYYPGATYQLPQPGTTSTEGNPYAKYSNVQNSVKELCAWLNRHGVTKLDITTPDEYASALKNLGYYGDSQSNYTSGLKAAWAKINWSAIAIAAGSSLAFVVLAVVAVYIFTKG